jgi:mannose-6-phosphate isomerase
MFDWNRVGADGKPRELHIDKAADVLDYCEGTAGALMQVPYRFEGLDRIALIADRHFVVERITASSEPASIATNGRPLIVMSLDAPVEVTCDGVAVALSSYQTALIPAAAQRCTLRADAGSAAAGETAEAPFMFVTPPREQEQLAIRLLAAGVEQAKIDGFMEQF